MGVTIRNSIVIGAEPDASSWLQDFVDDESHRLRRGLVARFGVEVGSEAYGDAMSWAVEHSGRLATMASPLGYLFRVGQSAARRHVRVARRPAALPPVEAHHEPHIEPKLPVALERLRPLERTAVVLVHCHGWTYHEVADLLGVEVTTINNLVHRGMSKLRRTLGVNA